MFDVEQFHQFMSSSTSSSTAVSPTPATTTIIIHPPPPNTTYSPLMIPSTQTSTNHNNPNFHLSSSSPFDHHHPLLFPPNYQLGNQLFQSNDHNFVLGRHDDDQYMNDDTAAADECKHHVDLAAAGAGAGIQHMNNDSWSNDEVVQLLRIKSTATTNSSHTNYCFKPHNWDHVSRKLAEMGYKRSAESCKEKFEEETCRSFGSSSSMGYKSSSNRYLISEELDENLYHNSDHQNITHHLESPDQNDNHQEEAQLHEKKEGEELNPESQQQQQVEQIIRHSGDADAEARKGNYNKRKRKFKLVKGLCVDFVNKMMAQQEEMHKKLLEDMEKHEKEKITREEAWRKEEMERVKRDIDMREHEQELARDRQCTITECLNKITCLDQKIQVTLLQGLQTADIPLPPPDHENKITKDRKRWPRDEVLALINIRSCNVNHGGDEYDDINIGNNNNSNKGAGGGSGGGGSVWERISQGMLELGYKRSAKRCKEKWENINKYFRKTKDANKKRPLDSRTCPYYHELTKLYNQQKQQQQAAAAAASSNTQNCNNTATTPQNS